MTNRIRTQAHAEPISAALGLLPPRIRARVNHAHFFAGSDPVFAGIHTFETASYARSYRDTAHACWPIHFSHRPVSDRVSTIVLPTVEEPHVVVHELGHVLHEAINFDCPVPKPTTAYAHTNDWEAFAEAFTAWICPDAYHDAAQRLAADKQTLELFAELAR